MFQRDRIVNVFAGVGVLATALVSVVGLGVWTGRLRVSVSRTKSETKQEHVEQSPPTNPQ